jgi:hypothetical protein
MSAAGVDFEHKPNRARAVLNWALALGTIIGAAALVLLAYGKVMGTAACTADACEVPSEGLFTVLLYGPPVVAAVAVVLSFFTAKRRKGFLVPLVAWILLGVDLALLMTSFRS